MSDVRIAVAAHKPYWMPDDPLYVPVQAGALGKDPIPGYRRDDEGGRNANVSVRCEGIALEGLGQ